jgi:hypothetical protein
MGPFVTNLTNVKKYGPNIQPKSSGMEVVLLTDLKCDALAISGFKTETKYSMYVCPGIKFTHVPYRKLIQNNECLNIICLLHEYCLTKD